MRKLSLAALAALLLIAGACTSDDKETSAPSAIPEETGPVLAEAQKLPALGVKAQTLEEPEVIPGEVVVVFKESTSPTEERQVLRSLDSGYAARQDEESVLEVAEVPEDATVKEFANELEEQPEVVASAPNYVRHAYASPNDPALTELWGLNNTGQPVDGQAGTADADIDAPEAWDITTGSEEVVVAVVDSGVAYDHPDLAPNIWANPGESGDGKEANGVDDDGNGYIDDVRGFDFVQNDNDPYDLNEHGTHVAGTIGARGNDGQGVTGVAWNTKIMPIRVLDMAGSGRDSWIVAGFEYAGRMGADIVNASLGGPGSGLIFDAVFQKYPNTLFVLAAGNDGSNNDQVPASPCNSPLPNVICVAATDSRDTLANFSNFGANNVDIAAPGVSIMSTMPSFDVLNSEDFEAETLSWVEEESSGVWQKVTGQNGNHFLDNSPNGPYNDNLKSTFKVGSPVELTNGCQFQYIAKIKVQAGPDWIQLQASKDGTNWQPAGPRLTGDAGFVNVAQDLSAFGSGPTWLRFRMETDAAGNDEGVVMDDLKTQCVSRTFGGDEYVRLNGTSMASPHVAGAAALLLAANPQANVQALKDALLQTVDPVPSLSGKVGTGGRLNVFNALKRITGQG